MAIEGKDTVQTRPIRLGMVGGGKDAFIGAVHRIAARIDGAYDLVAGALSSTPEKALESGRALGLKEDRIYGSFEEMAKREARLKDGIEAVAIVTPNHMHYPAAKEFLKRGIHVICDKPLTSTLADAKKFVKAAESSDALFFLTHNYTGYPMVRQAREMVASGDLGTIRVVQVEYPQDWLTVEQHNKQADWRTDPARTGLGGSTGDIGTHAYNLACFITGQSAESLAADLQSFVPGRQVDDNGHVMLRYASGARGMLWCSQVAPGNENNLKIRIYGDKAGLEWHQEDPNYLHYTPFGKPKQLLTRGGAGMLDSIASATRVPPGHPEGYLEGFANLYKDAADAIRAHQSGKDASSLVPGITDGLAGVRFVDACVRSSAKNAAWVKLDG
ncbi:MULTISPECIES: Gfo/Idh/MocA family protein [Stappiaceae]|jgi:predicted dehydrogenase|uniref:Glucose--fructose oxidoreductase n=2 Tax=Roseibium TaxID=150830 RepID=A0A0M6Y6Y8_9HYPH|nr:MULTISPECIES: Gfo/Idh/MocA family oxidoreductase [Stappiaceae]MCR9280435.1 Gfo/Idh/MocA family oxidoreductase [Paracoccaceae bacterium]MEC9468542.1 Gfo/Idh/MocA family oxidoreductase [Pseudomonadota bacterium]AQQ02850.1 oxidoreductase [Roseibium aggregatum]ERP95763.1 oxidoreductase [Labrenzia sp. C1B10]ERS05829.1 oxidoreductase [Labrenzia sp. C1B70]